jgi:hypothetical protein
MAQNFAVRVRRKVDMKAHKARAGAAWAGRSSWQYLYDEAYEYAIPYRRPAGKVGKGARGADRVFDNTAIVSSFRFAGQLQKDMFPPGQAFFSLQAGPIIKATLPDSERVAMQRELDQVTKLVSAFFMTGEWDSSINETFIDLGAGTGALLLLRGDTRRPLRFVNVPFDEIALELGAYNEIAAIFWKSEMTPRQIREAFPDGTFPESFKQITDANLEKAITIHQDFIREGNQWRFVAYIDDSEAPIAQETYRSQPMAVVRYHRVPGEAYGRGPILIALPTIKTLNKAMELTLKSAAIQMLGIWGYRPGGAFNPDTARIAPGAWWAMSSTGGVLGPDVTRMDASSGRIDVGNLMTQELRTQVQLAMHDDQLPNTDGATPRSASEIMARMRRISENYLGAFGRLVHEIVPVVVRRAIEILYDMGVLETDISIDDLLIRVDVISPMAQALKAGALAKIIEFIELILAIKGPEQLEMLMKVDEALTHIGLETGVPAEFILTKEEKEELMKRLAAAAAQMAAAQADEEAAGAGAEQAA